MEDLERIERKLDTIEIDLYRITEMYYNRIRGLEDDVKYKQAECDSIKYDFCEKMVYRNKDKIEEVFDGKVFSCDEDIPDEMMMKCFTYEEFFELVKCGFSLDEIRNEVGVISWNVKKDDSEKESKK